MKRQARECQFCKRDSGSKRRRSAKRAARRLRAERLEDRRVLATLWVSTTGDDGGAGTQVDPFLTIQRAIDEADESVTPGADSIRVLAGTYLESLVIDDADPLTIQGLGAVTIDADGVGTVIEIFDSHVTLKNLELTGGGAVDVGGPDEEFGDGIDFFGSGAAGTALILDQVHVHSNDAVTGEDFGWGLFASGVETVHINRSRFDNNTVGASINDASTLTVNYTTAEDNRDIGIDTLSVDTQNFLAVTANNNGLGPDPESGFDLSGGDITMRQVTANGNTFSGLRVIDALTLSVNSGTFNENDVHGIDLGFIDDTSLSVINAHENLEDGINALGASGTLSVRLTKANGNFDNGLDAATFDAVSVSSSEFIDNGDDGLNIDDVFEAVVDQVLAALNGDDGIDIDETFAAEVRNSRSNNNVDDGFDFDFTGGVLLSNVTGTGNDAGTSIADALLVEINNGRFFANRSGLDIFAVDAVTLNNVSATNNLENGLSIEGDSTGGIFTTVEINRGLYMQNGIDGINIFEADDVTLSGVSLIANGDDGLDVSSSGLVTLDRVMALYNGDEDIIII